MTSQLTGSDEREKRKKRATTDRRGLHGRRTADEDEGLLSALSALHEN